MTFLVSLLFMIPAYSNIKFLFFLTLVCLLFVFKSSEPMHTASKERKVPARHIIKPLILSD